MSEYLGWKAGIIPTNDDNLRYITSQVIALDERRRQEQAAQQAAEARRQGELLDYMDKATSGAMFETDPSKSADITNLLLGAKGGLLQEIKKNPDPVAFAQKVNQAVGGIAGLAKTYKSFGSALRDEAAKRAKLDPSIDWAAAVDVALSDAFDMRDKTGKVVGRKPLNEIDPSDPAGHLSRVVMNHKGKLLAANRYSTLRCHLSTKKADAKEITVPTEYDENTFDVKKEGGKLRLSPYYVPKVNQRGGIIGTEVIKEPLKIDGKPIMGKDNTPVMVAPENIYNEFVVPGSGTAAAIEQEMEERFPGTDPNSLEAEVKRRLIFTEQMDKFNPSDFEPIDESGKLKSQKKKEDNAERRIQLAEAASARQDRKTNAILQNMQTGTQSRDLFGEVVSVVKAKQSETNPVKRAIGNSGLARFIPGMSLVAGTTSLSELPAEAIAKVGGYLEKTYSKDDASKINSDDIKISFNESSGKIEVYGPEKPGDKKSSKLKRKLTLSPNDFNLGDGVNPSKAERQDALSEYGTGAPKQSSKGSKSKKKDDPLGLGL